MSRTIFKTNSISKRELKDLLQAIFVAEILNPSKCLWFISPWISNISLIDNSSGAFCHLDPDWPKTKIRLVDVIRKLIELGTTIVIAARVDEHNDNVIYQLQRYAEETDSQDRLIILRDDILHMKGIIADGFYFTGSMNLTFNGLEKWDEHVTFNTAQKEVAEYKIQFRNYYGGV